MSRPNPLHNYRPKRNGLQTGGLYAAIGLAGSVALLCMLAFLMGMILGGMGDELMLWMMRQ